jgi:hypothetical protein
VLNLGLTVVLPLGLTTPAQRVDVVSIHMSR